MTIKSKYTYTEIKQLEKAIILDERRGSKFLLENVQGLRTLGIKVTVGKGSRLLRGEYKDVFIERDTPGDFLIVEIPSERVKALRNSVRLKKDAEAKHQRDLASIPTKLRNNG